MNVPDDLLYTESHEWIRREGENIRVGITDHAQAELTDVVFVEVPPIAGTIVEGNKALEANPALINTDPFGEGWIFLLKIEDPESLKNLKDAAGYRALIG